MIAKVAGSEKGGDSVFITRRVDVAGKKCSVDKNAEYDTVGYVVWFR